VSRAFFGENGGNGRGCAGTAFEDQACMKMVDFDVAPFLVIWETTQACALACRHCRASARPWRDPRELTTDEGRRLIAGIAEMGTPLLVFSGGDPASRPDLVELVRSAKAQGLRTATIPAATSTLEESAIVALKEAGLDQMALSLEFCDPARHDTFRGVSGAHAKTMQAAGWAKAAGLPLQINTTVCGETAPYLEEMAEFVERLGVVFWEVFFLIPMGRGRDLAALTAPQCEKLFDVLYRAQKKGKFIVKVTEAPHYRRHVFQRERVERSTRPAQAVTMPTMLTTSEGPGHTLGLAPRGVNAGKGFLFVSHVGEIYPSGFLPLMGGDVRTCGIAEVYRKTPLFRGLRNPERLKGRCGECEFRDICGGSRARALALSGDPFESDPWCAYEPRPAGEAHAAEIGKTA
jgi:AdoMet-dependent heme synthase